ncbi:hypothetical protein ES703_61916 [subsurface metagenome]
MESNTGSGTTSNPKHDVLFLGEGDDIPDDQEIVGKLGLLDYFQLIVKPLFYLRGRLGVKMVQILVTEFSQKLDIRFPFRQLHLRQMKSPKLELKVTHFSNALGVLQCLRDITVKLCHLLRTLEIEKVSGHLQSFVIVDGSVSANTQQ